MDKNTYTTHGFVYALIICFIFSANSYAAEISSTNIVGNDSKKILGIELNSDTAEKIQEKLGNAEKNNFSFEGTSNGVFEYGEIDELYYENTAKDCSVIIKYARRRVEGKSEPFTECSLTFYDLKAFRKDNKKYLLVSLPCQVIKTQSGLRLGLTGAEVKEIYGNPSRFTDDYWEYTDNKKLNNFKISIQFREDKIIKISIFRYIR